MWNRLVSNCYKVVRNASASYRSPFSRASKSRRTDTLVRNNILPRASNIMSISSTFCTGTNKINTIPTLNEVQSYNTDQLCRWLASYSEETSNNTNSTAANNINTHARVFNDQTVTALRGQLVDGPSLFNYPSARSIQCSGVQHKQAQRLFELIQLIKDSK